MMKGFLKEFFGWGGYTREPEGFMSWQHLTFVTSLMIIMAVLAVYFGRKNRHATDMKKNRVLVVAAIMIDSFELLKIVLRCVQDKDPWAWLYVLPLFLCSIMLIALPMAAFCKGRAKEACLDFVMIFGLLGAVLGTYGAGQNYNAYPVLGFDNMVSGITHSISGFAALYIGISGMASLKKKNIPISFAILFGFATCAMIANGLLDYNYMFLVRGDGTPYDILYNWVDGNPVLYPMCVILLFLVYMAAFYGVNYLIRARTARKATLAETA